MTNNRTGAKRQDTVVSRIVRHVRSTIEKGLYARGVLRADRLALPDFLGIGAQKAGTTWLYENLKAHPDLFLAEPKELHYFDWAFDGTLRSYSRHFAGAAPRVKGEITPNYCTLPASRIAFLQKIVPRVRLILLLRDPIERAWSQAVMNLAATTGRSVEEIPDAEFLRHFASTRSVSRGDYLVNLDRWRRFFPDEQFFIGFFESIATEPRTLLAGVFHFLGVSTAVDWERFPAARVVRAGPGVVLPARFRRVLAEYYAPDIERLYDRFGAAVAGWRIGVEESRP